MTYRYIHKLNKIRNAHYVRPVRTSFSLCYNAAAGANGTSHRCYFQIKKINVNASLVLREIPYHFILHSPIHNKTRGCSWPAPT